MLHSAPVRALCFLFLAALLAACPMVDQSVVKQFPLDGVQRVILRASAADWAAVTADPQATMLEVSGVPPSDPANYTNQPGRREITPSGLTFVAQQFGDTLVVSAAAETPTNQLQRLRVRAPRGVEVILEPQPFAADGAPDLRPPDGAVEDEAAGVDQAQPPVALDAGVLVVYNRSGCFDGVDDTLTVYADGRLVLEDRGGAVHEAQAAAPALAAVRQRLAQPEFSELAAYYPAMGADLCVYTVTARDADGQPRTVTTMDAAQTPAYLEQLADELEALRQQVKRGATGVTPPPGAAQPSTLALLSIYDEQADDAAAQAFRRAVSEFEESTGVRVELDQADGNVIGLLLLTYAAAGMPPDLALTDPEQLGDLREYGMLADLNALLAPEFVASYAGEEDALCVVEGRRACMAGPAGLLWVIPKAAASPAGAAMLLEVLMENRE